VFVGDYTWIISGPVDATSLAIPAMVEGAPFTDMVEMSGVLSAVLLLSREAEGSTPELWLGARAYTQEFLMSYNP